MNFSRLAKPYTWLTDHALWRSAMPDIAKQLPPSGVSLRLVDLGCGSGVTLHYLHQLRPDIAPLGFDLAGGMLRLGRGRYPEMVFSQADALHLPLPADSVDAVLIQRLYYFTPHKAALLAEALRVLRHGGRLIMVDPLAGRSPWSAWRVARYGIRSVLDMAAWHLAARAVGGVTTQGIAEQLQTAGYARILAEVILEGWAVLSRGEKPYPANASTVERVAVGADLKTEDQTETGRILQGAEIKALSSARYIHLLIQQRPNKPAWKLAPHEVITWGAAACLSAEGKPIALGFSSLPKAVAFMQEAVMTGAIQDISKVAKFSLATAASWDFPILFNPRLETLQAEYRLSGVLIGVDPTSAEAPDE